MSGVTSGGGGGALHQDGEPVSVVMFPDEALTVPDGETWVVYLASTTGISVGSAANAAAPVATDDSIPAVLTAGQKIESQGGVNGSSLHVSGWSL